VHTQRNKNNERKCREIFAAALFGGSASCAEWEFNFKNFSSFLFNFLKVNFTSAIN
jgi:hypothetical protein